MCTFHHQVLPAYHNRFEVSIAGGINLFLKVISFTEELFDSVNPKKRNTHCCMSSLKFSQALLNAKKDCSLNIRSTNVFVLLAGGIANIVCSHERACYVYTVSATRCIVKDLSHSVL